MAHNRAERMRELRRRRKRREKIRKLRARIAAARHEAERAQLIAKLRRISPYAPIEISG